MIDQISFTDTLLDAAKEVFETMIFMDIARNPEDENPIEHDSFLGTITFNGDLEGCLGICCSETCAGTIAANMLGLEPTEISKEDINDAMGEVANMIMGSIKSRIQNAVGSIRVSIPSVVRGCKLENNLGEASVKVLEKVSFEGEHTAELSFLYRQKTGE